MRIWDLKTGRCMRKSKISNQIYIGLSHHWPLPVEAHNPFAQCVAWGPVPVAEGKGDDADRTVNVVATGGTDKVCYVCLMCFTYNVISLL
jgi:platelet-activating factor acetylhydrolase IB subunit alpha